MLKFNLSTTFLRMHLLHSPRLFVLSLWRNARTCRIASIACLLMLLLACSLASGCATIISGRSDIISVSTDAKTPIKATLQTSKIVKHIELPDEDVKLRRTSGGVKVTLLDECYKVVRKELKVDAQNVSDDINNNTGNNIELKQSDENVSSKEVVELADNEYMINSNLNPAMLWNLVFFPGGTVIGVLIDLGTSAIFSYEEHTIIPVTNICEQAD